MSAQTAVAKELIAARAELLKLRQALSLVSIQCENLHHAKKDTHKLGEPCPVEQRLLKLLDTSE
jgi:hypothetical protein